MSFYLYNRESMDICEEDDYEIVGKDFTKYYYETYDNSFWELSNLFTKDSCITFLGTEYTSFYDFSRALLNDGIWKFCHYYIEGRSQPVGNFGILVLINGSLSVNTNLYKHKFTEIILLKKNRDDNNYYISNVIFNLID